MNIVAIADTHGFHHQVKCPAGDVLLVAGDICSFGTLEEVKEFRNWLQEQPCPHKIVVAGNHDAPFAHEQKLARQTLTEKAPDIIYLQDSSIEIDDVLFYGSPWTPTFMNWHFMADRGEQIREKWARIPKTTDVLITHGLPSTILDTARGIPLGCEELLTTISRVQPRYHIFGHIHEGHGMTMKKSTIFINASVCDSRYRAINNPVVLDL